MKYEFNVTENILDVREMTQDEIKQDKKNQSDLAKKLSDEQSQIEAKSNAKTAIADRLGLTADELQVLLG
jgi:hypothetical protein